MKKVDIIVPVYNAYEYTEECIKSILENTDLKENSLILINDKSPDKKILPMLNKYKEENLDKNIKVLENEVNSGFVKTVNFGMKFSKNDVILLNSDTEVTKNWLEKIRNCAYSNEYIATVTPLTNNGTIASVPNFGIDNELPKNMTLKEYAKMIEEISVKRYPELTTGNGFCMYIKRSVIDEIGYFDDITFEKGYGEENDFCYRALDYGYINVLCDDTFIYHKGSQSFKKENLTKSRAEVIDLHMKKLRKKYPIYTAKTDNLLMKNPFRDIQQNIFLNTLIFGKKRILFLVNEWEEDMNMTGGTSLHLKDIINGIKDNTACFVISPNKNELTRFDLYLYVKDYGRKIYSFNTDINDYGQITYTNNMYKEMLDELFKAFKFNIVHVHHLLFQTFDIIDIAKKYNTYSIISLHDLYLSCPSINMVYKEKYCEVNKDRDCKQCLNRRYGLNNEIINNWRNTSYALLKRFDKIIVPSENTKKQFEDKYKGLNIEVIEHGVEINKFEKNNITKDTFDIAFVGVMVPHKGSRILNELINKNNTKNIRIHLFGRADDKTLSKNRKNYIYHGQYERGDLSKLLSENNIDLVCIFATWPETYSYTLTESYMASIPVLTFDIGAVGDRVTKDKLGYTIKFDESVDNILNKIKQIKENKKEYNQIIENFNNYEFKTTSKMQEEYKNIYDLVNDEKKVYANIYKLNDYNTRNIAQDFEMFKIKYGNIIHKYERIKRTLIWKIAKKIKLKIKKG